MEQRFREQTEPQRVLGLPRVEGFEKSGVSSNAEVRQYLLDTFPERHVNNITMESVRYRDEVVSGKEKDSVELGHRDKREVVPGTMVFNKEIVINRQTADGNPDPAELRNTLAHEVGHQVYDAYLPGEHQETWRALSGERPADQCVSPYAQTNPHEDFAESYMAYVRDPWDLKEASPDKYDFLRNKVFGGREYALEPKNSEQN
jgi:Mlc titration factor MtfA (ptsG expression regulator)